MIHQHSSSSSSSSFRATTSSATSSARGAGFQRVLTDQQQQAQSSNKKGKRQHTQHQVERMNLSDSLARIIDEKLEAVLNGPLRDMFTSFQQSTVGEVQRGVTSELERTVNVLKRSFAAANSSSTEANGEPGVTYVKHYNLLLGSLFLGYFSYQQLSIYNYQSSSWVTSCCCLGCCVACICLQPH
jgi:hypothetical protein